MQTVVFQICNMAKTARKCKCRSSFLMIVCISTIAYALVDLTEANNDYFKFCAVLWIFY